MDLTIGNVGIRQDAQGRYCLNDLHRAAVASGANQRTKEPGKFLASPQTVELIDEIGTTQNSGSSPVFTAEGKTGGTFVCKELVYAYAMWVSPAFNLKVIRAYDEQQKRPAVDPMAALNDPATMRGLLLNYSEKVLALETKVSEQAPKVAGFDRIALTDGSMCIRDAAKTLSVSEKKLAETLITEGWAYRRPMGTALLAHSKALKAGRMTHKISTGSRGDGSEWANTQARITTKGISELAVIIAKSGLC